MIVSVKLEQEDYDVIHDIIMEICEEDISNQTAEDFWMELPEEIQSKAIQWGSNDTCYREDAYVCLKEQFEKRNEV